MPKPTNPTPPDLRPAKEAAVRLFLVDKKTGTPIYGLLVSVLAESPAVSKAPRKSASAADQPQILASHQTDQCGFVSVKLDLSTIAGRSRLIVAIGAAKSEALVLDVADLLSGNDVHTIQLDAAAHANIPRHLALPSVMSPDIRDLTVSPGSIGLIPQLLPGGGLCRQLMPTTMGVQRFEAFLVRANICDLSTVKCGDDVQFARGKMLEFEIVWHPVGTALGELLNTISLAPCEQVNIAVADWMRHEMASQTQAVDVQQQSFQEMNHNRLIEEAMQSSIQNKGSSWGVAGALKAKGGPFKKFDLTASFGGGYAQSQSTQNVSLNTSRQLSEHITQAASFVASQRSTVVFQATASEQQTYQTRTVRNHNHCHTLTLIYYQINRIYRVVTDYKGEREVILVKYDNADFDAERVYCNAELLKDALLDQSLLKCFEDLADALYCCELTPALPKERLMDSITLKFWVKEATSAGQLRIYLTTTTATAFWIATMNSQWAPGRLNTITANLPNSINPADLVSVSVHLDSSASNAPFGQVIASQIEITGHVIGDIDPLPLYSSQTDSVISGQDQPYSWWAWLKADAPNQPIKKNECVEKSCCIQKLLGHLNCHKRYYNSILWLNEDPNERVMRWSCCHGRDNEPFNLISQIKNDPIAVYGDFLVFAAAGSQLVDNPSVLPISKVVTMPTPGVFSEGILGQCDTCETIDPDRFWDWTKSPCPDSAPPVSSPPSPKPGVQPGDLKADAISNLITFSSVPGAPDSVLKDLISLLVSKADAGSAEAKDLLSKLLDTIKEGISPKPAGDAPAGGK